MKYTVYILYSHEDKNLYVGCTSDLQRRMKLHAEGKIQSTKNRRPVELIFQEVFQDKAEAFNRERFLKSLWAGREKRKIKENFLKRKRMF